VQHEPKTVFVRSWFQDDQLGSGHEERVRGGERVLVPVYIVTEHGDVCMLVTYTEDRLNSVNLFYVLHNINTVCLCGHAITL